MTNYWMVRAERKAILLEDFLTKGIVTIGGRHIGDLSHYTSQQELLGKVMQVHSEWKIGKQRMWASQIYRFAHEIQEKDKVLTYDPQRRVYHVGVVSGPYQYQSNIAGRHPNYHKVNWLAEVQRDQLSATTKNSLGAISSLFKIPDEAAEEIEQAASNGDMSVAEAGTRYNVQEDEGFLLEDLEEKAAEFIKDHLSKLDWDDMQELVAGLLRGMGYKTRVSPSGPDRGKDIIASPDGFGFENPRIVVEVKHRVSAMGSQEIRSFLGGRHQNDKGLYVSTGGFTKDAYYEAERANIPLTLMNLDDLATAVVENYEKLDIQTQQLIPLKKVFWPVS